METRAPRPYADPYVAGVCLGAVLLAAFVIMGRGLGAFGAFATTAAGLTAFVDPGAASSNPYFAHYVSAAGGPWLDWLLLEIVGVIIGGYLSARFAGRLTVRVERGTRISSRGRLISASAFGYSEDVLRRCMTRSFTVERFAACAGPDRPVGAVRLSPGLATNRSDVERAVELIATFAR